jgi:hypothetical protein
MLFFNLLPVTTAYFAVPALPVVEPVPSSQSAG